MSEIKTNCKEIKEDKLELFTSDTNASPNFFDPYKKSSSELAEKHRRARIVGKVEKNIRNSIIEKCECCGFPIDAEKFSLCCSVSEFGEIGPGFPLYFKFINILGLILFIGICIVGLPCMIGNILANKGNE